MERYLARAGKVKWGNNMTIGKKKGPKKKKKLGYLI
jgi:hypothetical protein